MVRCSAINCSNDSRLGWKMHRFPADVERHKIWLVNCGREQWIPRPSAVLCSAHFEESQYELNRADGRKLLKKSGIPTLFNLPNPPQILSGNHLEGITCPKPHPLPTLHLHVPGKDSPFEGNITIKKEYEESEEDVAQQQIKILKCENESMRQEISEFEKHNKHMTKVVFELEKHNRLMSIRLIELEKNIKVLNKKNSDLERQNEDLTSKLNCCFSEEQFARMEKMLKLGTIERYIPDC